MIGYHQTLPFEINQKVVIPKGTTVTSTNPAKKTYVTKRQMTITVRSVDQGSEMTEQMYQNKQQHEGFVVFGSTLYPKMETVNGEVVTRQYRALSNPKILWAGTGGYWCSVEIRQLL